MSARASVGMTKSGGRTPTTWADFWNLKDFPGNRTLRRHVDSTISQLRTTLGHEPAEGEIADALGMTGEKYGETLEQLRTLEVAMIRQLDDSNPDHQPLLDICIDPDIGPELKLQRRELRSLLADAIGKLPDRERQVIALYYEEELTMAEIGAVLGVCESRVSQLRSLAIARLRSSLSEAIPAGRAH